MTFQVASAAAQAQSGEGCTAAAAAAAMLTQVVSWWGPAWRSGTHDTQGVNTDKVLLTVMQEVEKQQHLKVAFHLEPYEGRSGLCLCGPAHKAVEPDSKSASNYQEPQ